MPSSPQWVFDRFRLVPDHACLWRGAEVLALPPKAFDLLHYFVRHPDRVLPKDELLDAVWPETAVTDAVVRVTIGLLRTESHYQKALALAEAALAQVEATSAPQAG